MKKIAIMIQNIIQWYSVKPLVELLSQKPDIKTDILIFDPQKNDTGYHNIANSLRQAIKNDGFAITSKPNSSGYQVTLAPYSNMITFPSKYCLGYCYGAATTKPALTLQPEFKKGFHGLFVHDTYGAELFSIYGKTYIVPYLYLKPFHRKALPKKPTILFLPTYHEKSTAETVEALMKLKKDYRIIAKKHHGTDHLQEEDSTRQILESLTDELYDSTQYIVPLFEKADVVLSDNSGASMDALYAKMPIAITAPEINNGFPGIDTLQYQLVQTGVIPYTDKSTPINLRKIIQLALTKRQQAIQSAKSDELFPVKKGRAEKWFEVIEQYLNDKIDANYAIMHDYIVKTSDNLEKDNINLRNMVKSINSSNQALQNEIAGLRQQLSLREQELSTYKNSRLHRIINKITKH